MLNLILIISFSFFAHEVSSIESPIKFPHVENDVAYSKVASLPFAVADDKVFYGQDSEQFSLFWRSKKSQKNNKKPLVILLHGGCWLSAYDIEHTYALSTGLAQSGFNVWSIEYRRSGETGGGWPITFDDVKAGIIASSIYNENEFKLADTIIVGHSAGGHLALLAASKFNHLKGVIGLAAIIDIESYSRGENSCQQVTKEFMQGIPEDKPSAYDLANPIKQILHRNSIILQGNKDTIVPLSQLDQLKKNVIVVDGVGHFDWIHPGSHAFQTLIQQLNKLSNEY